MKFFSTAAAFSLFAALTAAETTCVQNKFDKNDNKKLLAYICAQNQFQPSIIESKEIKNISIKDVNLKEWIAMKSQDEYKALNESLSMYKLQLEQFKQNQKIDRLIKASSGFGRE